MASTLPALSGRETVRAFEKPGWKTARQSGSHIMLVKEGHSATLSVPDHREVAKGTLRSVIRAAGLTVNEPCINGSQACHAERSEVSAYLRQILRPQASE